MTSNAVAPMTYPNNPPRTDVMVVISAYLQALLGVAKHMGASMTSGGTGKKDDSAKLKSPKYLGALGNLDQISAFSNSGENIFI